MQMMERTLLITVQTDELLPLLVLSVIMNENREEPFNGS